MVDITDNKSYFSKEFTPLRESSTALSSSNNQSGVTDESIKIESDKYGDAKPRRIIIKASIVHDKSY
jgi:hypothetical protein